MNKLRTIFGLLVGLSSGRVLALDLTGQVLTLDGKGKSGVIVTIAGSSLSTTTDASGYWAFGAYTNLRRGASENRKVTKKLVMRDGHIQAVWNGFDPVGRPATGLTVPAYSARAKDVQSKVDTLLFSWNGKVFLRDTVSAARVGIVRTFDTTWNPSIIYGWLSDERDSHLYRTISIASMTWMAENLNYSAGQTIGVCYNDADGATTSGSEDTCKRYGRIYKWTEAVAGDSTSDPMPDQARGICPTGWHVTNTTEWNNLAAAVTSSVGCTKLRSAYFWPVADRGVDTIGFRALPAGYQSNWKYSFNGLGTYTTFWFSTKWGDTQGRTVYFSPGKVYLWWGEDDMDMKYSVRCAKD